jgi:hypothetical protein
VLLVVAVKAVAVSVPVISPVSLPVRDKAGVVVGLVTVPVKPFPLVKEKFVTVPPKLGDVLVIVMLVPEGVTDIPAPATRVREPVKPFRPVTPVPPNTGYLA